MQRNAMQQVQQSMLQVKDNSSQQGASEKVKLAEYRYMKTKRERDRERSRE